MGRKKKEKVDGDSNTNQTSPSKDKNTTFKMLSNHPEKIICDTANNQDLDSKTTTQLIDLSCLDIQNPAIIKRIEIDTYGEVLVKRLKAMGVVPEKQIMVLRKSCFGGPLHLRVGISTELAIRREEAKTIFVKPLIL